MVPQVRFELTFAVLKTVVLPLDDWGIIGALYFTSEAPKEGKEENNSFFVKLFIMKL